MARSWGFASVGVPACIFLDESEDIGDADAAGETEDGVGGEERVEGCSVAGVGTFVVDGYLYVGGGGRGEEAVVEGGGHS